MEETMKVTMNIKNKLLIVAILATSFIGTQLHAASASPDQHVDEQEMESLQKFKQAIIDDNEKSIEETLRKKEITKELVTRVTAQLNKKIKDSYSPVFIATKNNKPKILELLSLHGFDLNMRFVDNATPLIIASYYKCFDTVKYLVEKKVNVHAVDQDGKDAIAYAGSLGHKEIFRWLMQNANPYSGLRIPRDPALLEKRREKREERIASLAQRFKKQENAELKADELVVTPPLSLSEAKKQAISNLLYQAIDSEKLERVDVCLTQINSIPQIKLDPTPICYAARGGKLKSLQHLHEKHKMPLTGAEMAAAHAKQIAILQYIHDQRCADLADDYSSRNYAGRCIAAATVIEEEGTVNLKFWPKLACEQVPFSEAFFTDFCLAVDVNKLQKVKQLVNNSAFGELASLPKMRNPYTGDTLLIIAMRKAIQTGDMMITNFLLDAGINSFVSNYEGKSPLDIIIEDQNNKKMNKQSAMGVTIQRMLAKVKLDASLAYVQYLNKAARVGNSAFLQLVPDDALVAAVLNGKIEIIKLLLDHVAIDHIQDILKKYRKKELTFSAPKNFINESIKLLQSHADRKAAEQRKLEQAQKEKEEFLVACVVQTQVQNPAKKLLQQAAQQAQEKSSKPEEAQQVNVAERQEAPIKLAAEPAKLAKPISQEKLDKQKRDQALRLKLEEDARKKEAARSAAPEAQIVKVTLAPESEIVQQSTEKPKKKKRNKKKGSPLSDNQDSLAHQESVLRQDSPVLEPVMADSSNLPASIASELLLAQATAPELTITSFSNSQPSTSSSLTLASSSSSSASSSSSMLQESPEDIELIKNQNIALHEMNIALRKEAMMINQNLQADKTCAIKRARVLQEENQRLQQLLAAHGVLPVPAEGALQ